MITAAVILISLAVFIAVSEVIVPHKSSDYPGTKYREPKD